MYGAYAADRTRRLLRGAPRLVARHDTEQRHHAILAIDANAVLGRLHLKEHLTPQRSNGLLAMVERIRKDARHAIENAPTVH